MKLRILLDLDEVLADWCGPVCKAFGLSLDQVHKHWPTGRYGICKPLTDALVSLGMSHPNGKDIDEPELWAHIRQTPNFWESLPVLPWLDRMMKLVHQVCGDNWLIVTQAQPYYDPRSYTAKVHWLKEQFGHNFNRFAITCHKQELARPDTILIDDNEDNCAAFAAKGGMTIVFPRHHNYQYEHKINPMYVVERSLARYL